MNPEQLLNDVSTAVANRQKAESKKYTIFEKDGVIECKPLLQSPSGSTLIGVYTESELEKGFTQKQWSKIMNKLARILKGEPT